MVVSPLSLLLVQLTVCYCIKAQQLKVTITDFKINPTKEILPQTQTKNALDLFYVYINFLWRLDGNNGYSDFLAISLKEGRILVGLSFGGEALKINMERGPTLNNRKWHHVEVLHERKVGAW